MQKNIFQDPPPAESGLRTKEDNKEEEEKERKDGSSR